MATPLFSSLSPGLADQCDATGITTEYLHQQWTILSFCQIQDISHSVDWAVLWLT